MCARYVPARWALLAALVVGLAASGAAQSPSAPAFDVEVVAQRARAASGAAAQVDVYTAVPHTSLRFLARAGGFEASYGLTVQAYEVDERGRRQRLAVSRTVEREVGAADYDETQSPDRQDRAVLALDVPPGRYAFAVSVEDGASRRTLSREVAHRVRDLGGAAVSLSDPLLLSAYDRAGGTSTPVVGSALSTEMDEFWVAYDLYAPAATALEVTYVVTEQSQDRERPSFGALLGLAPRQQADAGAPVAVTEALDVQAGRTPVAFRIATEGLQVGDYTLAVRLADAAGETVAEVDKPFSVRWTGLDSQIADLDQAIAQLRFLAREGELRAIQNAPTPEEQRRQFLAFWTERDPTPGTPRNESMEQYYFRVSSANDRYGRVRDSGWNTDRGEVFIRFGEPDSVEEHPFDYGTQPYQIWTYPSIGRRFIFVDETGSGDFQLLTKIWDDRTRM